MKLTKFTAGLLALSIGTAGFVAPARASDQDVAMALGGLLTLFVVGKAIENNNKGRVVVETSRRDSDKWRGGNRGDAFNIPKACVVNVGSSRDRNDRYQNNDRNDRYQSKDRSRLVAIERCVERERHARASLPRACETRVSTKRGRVDAYDLGCLNNFGYRVAGGHDDRGRGHK